MADVCLDAVSPTGCGHYNVTVTVLGQSVTVHLAEEDLTLPLTELEQSDAAKMLVRLLRQSGVPLSAFPDRVVRGEEATSVKQYDILGAGSAVAKTNIGTTYVDVLVGANGIRSLVDWTGALEFRVILSVNIIGTGQLGVRLVRDSDTAVIVENANVGAAGERELDTGWQAIPAILIGAGQMLVRLQTKSTVVTDDPVFRRCLVLVR